MQLRIADLTVKVEAAIGLLDRTAAFYDKAVAGDDSALPELSRRMYVLKIFVSEAAVQVASDLITLCGARSTTRTQAVDMFWRNARTLSQHDNIDKQKGTVGRQMLGVELPALGIR